MSFKTSGGLISNDIIPHEGTRFYSPLRSHGQMRLSRFGFLTSTKLVANWFSCSCNRWKCLSTLFWRFSSTVVMLRSAWGVWFETYRGAGQNLLTVRYKLYIRCASSIPGHVMWDSWRTKWHWVTFFFSPSTSVFSLSVTFHHYCVLIFTL